MARAARWSRTWHRPLVRVDPDRWRDALEPPRRAADDLRADVPTMAPTGPAASRRLCGSADQSAPGRRRLRVGVGYSRPHRRRRSRATDVSAVDATELGGGQ